MSREGFLPILIRNKFFVSPNGVVTDDDREIAQFSLLALLHGLTACNANYLSRNKLPPLYNCGMSYAHKDGLRNEVVAAFQRLIDQVPDTPENQQLASQVLERIVVELWDDVATAYEQGWTDCKVLTAIRCAELNALLPAGQTAQPHITWRQIKPGDPGGHRPGDWMYHVRLRRPAASIGTNPPPMLFTPNGQTLEQAKNTMKNGQVVPMTGWLLEDPSMVLGMGWEAVYSRSNKRPASPEFKAWFEDATGLQWRPLIVGMDEVQTSAGQIVRKVA